MGTKPWYMSQTIICAGLGMVVALAKTIFHLNITDSQNAELISQGTNILLILFGAGAIHGRIKTSTAIDGTAAADKVSGKLTLHS